MKHIKKRPKNGTNKTFYDTHFIYAIFKHYYRTSNKTEKIKKNEALQQWQ